MSKPSASVPQTLLVYAWVCIVKVDDKGIKTYENHSILAQPDLWSAAREAHQRFTRKSPGFSSKPISIFLKG